MWARLGGIRHTGRRPWAWLPAALAMTVWCAGSSAGASPPMDGLADPPASVSPSPAYPNLCAPIGVDVSPVCLRLTLAAIDSARAREGVRPMRLPANFDRLSVAEQVFVAVDRERVDRGLPPFEGLTEPLDAAAAKAAAAARLPARPGPAFASSDAEWLGAVANGLDADYRWMYDDGPGSGVVGCGRQGQRGCWADRAVVLDRMGSRHLVMGVGFDPTADPSAGDRGGPSLAATFAAGRHGGAPYAYTWHEAWAATVAHTMRPLSSIPSTESNTGIADPARNITPVPDFTSVCADGGIDDSARCIDAVTAAVNRAHGLEGIPPMVLPGDFGQLSVPQQLLVAINLERVDRGLPPFLGLTPGLDANAQRGADAANDPPDPGRSYVLDDAEWAGGSANGLDAVYGWMYDDGFDSGNLDCLRPKASGCWGHRKGILDNFGSGARLVMGAALNPSGDTHRGDRGGTSMAVTLAVGENRATTFSYSWAQALAVLRGGSGS